MAVTAGAPDNGSTGEAGWPSRNHTSTTSRSLVKESCEIAAQQLDAWEDNHVHCGGRLAHDPVRAGQPRLDGARLGSPRMHRPGDGIAAQIAPGKHGIHNGHHMRLDVGLVHRLGRVAALDDDFALRP